MRRLISLLFLAAALAAAPAQSTPLPLSRGPYLQCATPHGIKIVWRSQASGAPGLRFGFLPTALDQALPPERILTLKSPRDLPAGSAEPALSAAPVGTRQFEADLTGLAPDTLYYYAITLDGQTLSGPPQGCSFRTLPTPGTPRDGLFWIVGDSGTGNRAQLAVHTAMRQWLAQEKRSLDGYLHVGDMAYGSGLDSEFQGYFFESYAETLRNTVCWPSMGNHEGAHSSGATARGPYYDAYICPTQAQSGGVASGTEAYYSFDFGQTHFICLNSHDLARDPAGAMAQWLKADLDKTKAQFLVAFWHHPPYTKGSHDSDKELQLVEMRSLILPILESGGVDLVFCGHSHIYERSMLMDGAYATPTVAENVILDDKDGNPASQGPYRKSQGLVPHQGTVQVVTGHGGTTLSREPRPSPVMRTSLLEFGSVLLDIKTNTLTASMLNSQGQIRDTFQIRKEGQVTPQRLAAPWQPPPFTGPRSVPMLPKDPADDPPPTLAANAVPLIPPSSEWHYLLGATPAPGWQSPGFTPTNWLSGPAGFGYDDNDDATLLPQMRGHSRFLCIRRAFDLSSVKTPVRLLLNISYDDGFIAYLNGKEVLRVNAESGSLDSIKGVSSHEAKGQFQLFLLPIPPGLLQAGPNVLAIEGYNDDLNSSDFTLHPALYLEPQATAP